LECNNNLFKRPKQDKVPASLRSFIILFRES
jgi:hypothetical protein